MRRIVGVLAFLCVGLMFPISLTAADKAPKTNPKTEAEKKADKEAEKAKITALAEGLKSADAAVQKQSLQDLLEWIKKGQHHAAENRAWWVPTMIETKHYQEIATVTEQMLIDVPEQGSGMLDGALEGMLPYRVESLLRLNKNEEALVAAKQYYNICGMKQSAAAIASVAQCLRAARPNDKDIDLKFKTEQQERSASDPAQLDKIPEPGSSILDSIKIDSTPYDQKAAKYLEEDPSSLMIRGTYALLGDKPRDAKDFYERSYAVYPTENPLSCMARAIRALHRSVGAANAWVISVKGTKPVK